MRLQFILTALILIIHINSFGQSFHIKNIDIISMEREAIQKGMDVLISDGMIQKIGPKLKTPSNASVVDGTGKFLIPGLHDMHAHFSYEQGDNKDYGEAELKLMLANGLTTVRITNGDENYLSARRNVKSGQWPGPDLVITSPQLVGSWPTMGRVFAGICKTPAQGDSLVRLYKKQGYDEIKLTFGVKRDVYNAIIETAKEVGIKVMGHVGDYVKLPLALQAKQQVEHMDQFIEMLMPDTTVNFGQSVSDMNLWREKAWQTVPQLDMNKISGLVDQVKKSGIYVTPTNYFFYSFFGKGINEDEEKAKISYQYIPDELKTVAWDVRKTYAARMASEPVRNRYIEIRKKMIEELWKADVPLMAGSDSPQWFTVAGFAIHEELQNLVLCGLTPYAALQTATINPAKYLGREKTSGTISIGKQADLVMLDKNPLENIKNAQQIHGVFIRGQWLPKNTLENYLTSARQQLTKK